MLQTISDHRRCLLKNRRSVASQLPMIECSHIRRDGNQKYITENFGHISYEGLLNCHYNDVNRTMMKIGQQKAEIFQNRE